MLNALTILVRPFSLRDGIEIVLVLVVCGFALWLLVNYVKMQPPFPQIIIFVVVVMMVWWLLTRFGVL